MSPSSSILQLKTPGCEQNKQAEDNSGRGKEDGFPGTRVNEGTAPRRGPPFLRLRKPPARAPAGARNDSARQVPGPRPAAAREEGAPGWKTCQRAHAVLAKYQRKDGGGLWLLHCATRRGAGLTFRLAPPGPSVRVKCG